MALLLFDIDGTLLRPVGLGRRAFEEALQDLYGRREGGERFLFDGLLDTQIASRTLEQMGVPTGDHEVTRLLEAYVERLRRQPAPDPGELRCPGVPSVLAEATSRGHHLALLTGNVREGAEVKLTFAALDGFFRARFGEGALLGAFGEDSPARPGLVPVALDRCAAAFGQRFETSDAWVVGDSPRDIDAARAGGVRCAAVATGLASKETLRGHGPDLLLKDLSDPRELWKAVEGTP